MKYYNGVPWATESVYVTYSDHQDYHYYQYYRHYYYSYYNYCYPVIRAS